MPFHSSAVATGLFNQTNLKAVYGGVAAGLGSLYLALGSGGVTAQEWVAVAIAALGTSGVVWGVPNKD